jgi:excisionase family DNA binding protein
VTIDQALRAAVVDAVAPLAGEIRDLRTEVAALRATSLPQFISVDEAATRLDVVPLTIRRMVARGEVVHRRAGRRILIDASSLRPADPATVASLARIARQS